MADIWIKVLTPATSYALLTLDELKAILNITTTAEDAQLSMWIDQYSDVIATMCQRTFAYEEVQETWRGDSMPFDAPRLFLSHYPVAEADLESVESPLGSVLDPTAYEIENGSGKMRIGGYWAEPIVVKYWGGYQLPDEAPAALKAACSLLIQAARTQSRMLAAGGLRSISHGDTHVQYQGPAQVFGKSGFAMPLQTATDAVNALLSAYMRYPV
jgi:hypothetical protein